MFKVQTEIQGQVFFPAIHGRNRKHADQIKKKKMAFVQRKKEKGTSQRTFPVKRTLTSLLWYTFYNGTSVDINQFCRNFISISCVLSVGVNFLPWFLSLFAVSAIKSMAVFPTQKMRIVEFHLPVQPSEPNPNDPGAQRSHLWPITFALHSHWPPTASQIRVPFSSLLVPVGSQLHAGKRSFKKCITRGLSWLAEM